MLLMLETGVELIAEPRLNCNCIGTEYILRQAAHSGCIGQQKIFVERRFEGPRIGNP